MNYTEGQLLSFTPFFFKSGAAPKKKYFIVLKHIEEQILMASLPTSKDRIPSDVAIQSGCINHPERAVNAFVFMPKESVTEHFAFPLPTFVYGEQVEQRVSLLEETNHGRSYVRRTTVLFRTVGLNSFR